MHVLGVVVAHLVLGFPISVATFGDARLKLAAVGDVNLPVHVFCVCRSPGPGISTS